MDKKILIALGLIGAFSIDNATGMNGIIENPSVNESQSMKTINDFSYDLRSLGPVNRLFDYFDYREPKKWSDALYTVKEIVDFYCVNQNVDKNMCASAVYGIFVHSESLKHFLNSVECTTDNAEILRNVFYLASKVRFANITDDALSKYGVFLEKIKKDEINHVILSSDYSDFVFPLVEQIGSALYE